MPGQASWCNPPPGMDIVVVATSLALRCCQPRQTHLGVGDVVAQICNAKSLPKPPTGEGE